MRAELRTIIIVVPAGTCSLPIMFMPYAKAKPTTLVVMKSRKMTAEKATPPTMPAATAFSRSTIHGASTWRWKKNVVFVSTRLSNGWWRPCPARMPG